MLNAFSVPVAPQGKSALATRQPWHYSSDCIVEVNQSPVALLKVKIDVATPPSRRSVCAEWGRYAQPMLSNILPLGPVTAQVSRLWRRQETRRDGLAARNEPLPTLTFG
jgi:hypothetical protein